MSAVPRRASPRRTSCSTLPGCLGGRAGRSRVPCRPASTRRVRAASSVPNGSSSRAAHNESRPKRVKNHGRPGRRGRSRPGSAPAPWPARTGRPGSGRTSAPDAAVVRGTTTSSHRGPAGRRRTVTAVASGARTRHRAPPARPRGQPRAVHAEPPDRASASGRRRRRRPAGRPTPSPPPPDVPRRRRGYGGRRRVADLAPARARPASRGQRPADPDDRVDDRRGAVETTTHALLDAAGADPAHPLDPHRRVGRVPSPSCRASPTKRTSCRARPAGGDALRLVRRRRSAPPRAAPGRRSGRTLRAVRAHLTVVPRPDLGRRGHAGDEVVQQRLERRPGDVAGQGQPP